MTYSAVIDPSPSVLGTVYLVGAGPGDPGLLTLKGRDLLQVADVVVYDALVSDPILAMINPQATVINVGKRSGRHTLPQSQTTGLLLELAHDYATIVRLKGGDPFVFGRGGEEMEDLVAAGVRVEVVPGVTSGIAAPAYSGIPLTHRAHSSSAIFVTGHEESDKYRPGVDWSAIAKAAETIVIYMGVHTLPQIVPQLLAAGKAPTTPIALIRWGTRPNSQTLIATLTTVIDQMQAAEFSAPAIAIIGTVVNLHQLHVQGTALGVTTGSVLSSTPVIVTAAMPVPAAPLTPHETPEPQSIPLTDSASLNNSAKPMELSAFDQLCAAIDGDIQELDWEQVSDRLKQWSAVFGGVPLTVEDRQRLADRAIALLLHGEIQDCRGLASVFRPAGSLAIKALSGLLIDREIQFEPRWFAGQILAQLNQVEAMAVLVAAIDSADEMTASIAINTLSHFGKTEVDLLVEELQRAPTLDSETNTVTRPSIVRALAQISDPIVITPLLGVVTDPDPTIRLLAIGALSAFDDDRILSILLKALHDTSAPIRKTALTSLGAKAQYQQQYGLTATQPADQVATSSIRRDASDATTTIDWLKHFQPLTLDLNPEVAVQAVIAIGRLSSAAAIETLLSLLRSPLTPPSQAIATVRALLQSPTRPTIEALLEVCTLEKAPASPQTPGLTLEIMRGLGRLRKSAVIPPVAVLLVDWCDRTLGDDADPRLEQCDPTLLQAIAYGLGHLGEPVGRVWLDRLAADPRDRVRITAIDALQKLPSP